MSGLGVLSTPEAAKVLGVKPAKLNFNVWNGTVPAPARIGKNFAWLPVDMERAAECLGIDRWSGSQ